MLVAGSVVFKQPPGRVAMGNHYNWWDWMPGADWRHPEGPGSTLDGRERHPVVHVAWEDVAPTPPGRAKTLPTEAEWEYAAGAGGTAGLRLGRGAGAEGQDAGQLLAGRVPWQNLALDGYERTAPVGSFPPNGYGLFDMIGNAWEWTADWYTDAARGGQPLLRSGAQSARRQPGGQRRSQRPRRAIPRKVLKGGSWACAENYCQRYRPAARMHHPIDTGTNHLSFRCVVRPVAGDVGGHPRDDQTR